MTKSFLMKFLALFLTGTMLVGVGCKSYDDDINRIDDKINNLDKQVIELNKLPARVAAVEITAAEFKAIDFSLYVKNADLVAKLNQIQTEFNTKLNGYVTTGALADAKKALEGQIAAKATIDEVKKWLADYAKKADVDNIADNIKAEIDAKVKALTNELTKITTNANDWLGPHFAKYMATYVTGSEFSNAANAAVLAQLTSANKAYVDAIMKLVDGDDPVLRQSDMDALKATYDAEIMKIWAAIGDLASRIQSLVYVPKNVAGVIEFGSMYIYNAATDEQIMLNNDFSADITFRVTPASLAKELVAQWTAGTIQMSFVPEEVRTRAEQDLVKITNVVAGADGKIIVTANCIYDFEAAKKVGSTIAIALNIAQAVADDEMQGIEFSSAYIVVDGGDFEVNDNLILATKDATGKYKTITDAAEYELIYNSKETLSILGNYSLVFAKGVDAYSTLEEAAAEYHWDNIPALAIANQSVAFEVAAMKDHYTITPTTIKGSTTPVQIAVKTPTATDVAKTIKVLTNVNMTIGADIVALTNAQVTSTVTVTAEPLKEIKDANTTLNWNYKEFTNGYKKEIILPTGSLTAKQFNNIAWDNVVWEVVKPKDSKVIGDIVVNTESVNEPYGDKDVQVLRYNVTGYKNGNGMVAVSANIQVSAAETIKVSGVITVNGLPDLKYTLVTPATPKYEYPANFVIVPVTDKLNKDLFATVPTASPKYFDTQADFDAFLATLKLDNIRQAKDETHNVTASLEGKNNNTGLQVRFRKSDLGDFNNVSYTYTAPKNALLGIDINSDVFFKIDITGSVSIEKNKSYYLKRGVDLNDGPTADDVKFMYAVSNLNKTANTVTIPNVDMAKGAYAVGKPVGATETVDITYTMKTKKPAGYTGNLPLIDGNAIEGSTGSLDWNGCQLDKVTIEVTLEVEGLMVDQKTYEVRLKTMIDVASWAAFTDGVLKVKSDNTEQSINLYTLMLTAAKDMQDPANALFEKIGGSGADKNEGKDLFTWASAAAGYGVTVTIDNSKITYVGGSAEQYTRFHLDKNDQKMFIADKSNSSLQEGVTIVATIPVTFTYKYAVALKGAAYAPVKFTKNITVKISNL